VIAWQNGFCFLYALDPPDRIGQIEWLLSRKVHRLAKERDVGYSFLFVHPDGGQLAEIGELLKAGIIRPVIDKVFPFNQAKEALAYLEKGRAKGKVVVQIR
jgi:NADPH:quinone reductase-like Zn-dependent oxidoreductase